MTDNHNVPPLLGEEEPSEHIQLASYIHSSYRTGREIDDGGLDDQIDIRQDTGLSVEARRYVTSGEDETIMDVPFWQLSWKAKNPNAERIAQIFARIPVPSASTKEYPAIPAHVRAWNDVLFELMSDNGARARYLFNSRGLTPYRGAANLDHTFTRNEQGELVAESSDFYRVDQPDTSVPLLAETQLYDLLMKCHLEHQAVNPQTQQYRRRASDFDS